MGVVTWKNIGQTNPAGILNAANDAAKAIGEGFAGVGEAAQGYADNRSASETDDFIKDLMSLGTQEERDTMIAEAQGGWLNIDDINATNYELGAPDREMDMFNQKLAAETVVNQDAAQLLHDNKMLQIYATNSGKTSKKPTYGPGSKDWGKNPIGPNGIFAINNPKNDNWTGWGGGYDDMDDTHFVESRAAFLNSKYAKDLNLNADYFNQLANDELLTFVDNNSLTKHDTFEFTSIDGITYELDNSKESQAAIAELIQNTYFKASDGVSPMLSTRQVNRYSYYDEFTKNNPELVKEVGYEGAKDYFTKIYNKNVKFNSGRLSKDVVAKIFGKITAEEKTSSLNIGEKYSQDVFEMAGNQVDNTYKDLSQEDLQDFIARLTKMGDSKSDFNWALLDHLNAKLLENAKK